MQDTHCGKKTYPGTFVKSNRFSHGHPSAQIILVCLQRVKEFWREGHQSDFIFAKNISCSIFLPLFNICHDKNLDINIPCLACTCHLVPSMRRNLVAVQLKINILICIIYSRKSICNPYLLGKVSDSANHLCYGGQIRGKLFLFVGQ